MDFVIRPIHIDDPRLLRNPSGNILDQFLLNEEGFIIDGPKSAKGEPIDYTDIISNETILERFTAQIFSCDAPHEECGSSGEVLSKWDKSQLSASLVTENEPINEVVIRDVWSRFQETVGYAGISLEVGHLVKDSDLIFVIGPIDFLRKASEMFGTEYVTKVLSFAKDEKFRSQIEAHEKRFNTKALMCLGTTALRGGGFSVFVLMASFEDVQKCAPQMAFMSLGFYDDIKAFSSVTRIDNRYSELTKLDKIFLKILYDKRLKTGMTRDAALPIIRQILTEIRPGAWQQNVCDNC